MIGLALAALTAFAAEPAVLDLDEPEVVPRGYRIGPIGGGPSVATGLAAVVGSNGGTNAMHVQARYGREDWSAGLRVPMASYRTQFGRGTDVGNIQLDGHAVMRRGSTVHGLGLEAHVNLGGRPYTWANKAEELWPGGGADIVWQVRTEGPLAWLGRASAGVHATRGFEPFPQVWARFGAAGGLDWSASRHVGLTAEAHAAWWEISPLELTGLLRLHPVDGMTVRGGALLPLGGWAGWTRSGLQGVKEATLLADLQLAI